VLYYRRKYIGGDYVNFSFDWQYVSHGTPYVTLAELGISFNTPSIDLLEKPKKIDVGFDKANLVIGFKAHDESSFSKGYDFAPRIKSEWVRIGCKDFIRELTKLTNISFKPAKKFVAQKDEQSNIVFISLKDHMVDGRDTESARDLEHQTSSHAPRPDTDERGDEYAL
jgi:hypothetical protein